jgi:hypothetical protein
MNRAESPKRLQCSVPKILDMGIPEDVEERFEYAGIPQIAECPHRALPNVAVLVLIPQQTEKRLEGACVPQLSEYLSRVLPNVAVLILQ